MTGRPYNRTLGLLRVALVYALVALLLILSRPTPWSLALGFPFVAAGCALRVWAAGHLRKSIELVTTGPYRYTRNPLYLGRLSIFTGLCLMARLPWGLSLVVLAGGFCVFFVYYLPRKERVEPARLGATHGQAYDAYRRAVPPLFPALRPWPGAGAGRWRRERMLRNREHWMIAGLLVVTALLTWRAARS